MTGGLFRYRVWTYAGVRDDNPWFLFSRQGRLTHAAWAAAARNQGGMRRWRSGRSAGRQIGQPERRAGLVSGGAAPRPERVQHPAPFAGRPNSHFEHRASKEPPRAYTQCPAAVVNDHGITIGGAKK